MKPFFISIEKPQEKKLKEIVESVFSKFENIGDIKIPREYVGSYWNDDEFGSVQWYVQQAYDFLRNQALTSKFWELFEREPWQREVPHYELMILETDLYSYGTNFVFGETRPKISGKKIVVDEYIDGRPRPTGVVVSTNRIKKWYGKNWGLAFYCILSHELGHFYGLPSSENPNFIKYGDSRAFSELDYFHCNDRNCVMEQVNVPGRMDLLEKALHLRKHRRLFCEYDLKTLRENLRKLYI